MNPFIILQSVLHFITIEKSFIIRTNKATAIHNNLLKSVRSQMKINQLFSIHIYDRLPFFKCSLILVHYVQQDTVKVLGFTKQ